MNSYHDPELEDILQDDELRRVAAVLSSVRSPEPPLDDAFRTSLRRQLMQQAWAMSEGRNSWWRRAFAPPGLAWAGAAAGLLLITSVVVFYALQRPGGFSTTIVATSPLDGNRSVALEQPILAAFNQPMDHPSLEPAVQITPATTVPARALAPRLPPCGHPRRQARPADLRVGQARGAFAHARAEAGWMGPGQDHLGSRRRVLYAGGRRVRPPGRCTAGDGIHHRPVDRT